VGYELHLSCTIREVGPLFLYPWVPCGKYKAVVPGWCDYVFLKLIIAWQRYFYWKRSIIPTAHNSDSPLPRQPITPTAHYSDGPFLRQCKIELNPQIHGLTRCIQQDVPSVRLNENVNKLTVFWQVFRKKLCHT
jgi:hypothetical protein